MPAKYFYKCIACNHMLLIPGDAPYKTVPQRNQTIVKGLETNLQSVYMLHEIDEAAEKIKANQLSPKDGECWLIGCHHPFFLLTSLQETQQCQPNLVDAYRMTSAWQAGILHCQ
jgi:hypothetical protein